MLLKNCFRFSLSLVKSFQLLKRNVLKMTKGFTMKVPFANLPRKVKGLLKGSNKGGGLKFHREFS